MNTLALIIGYSFLILSAFVVILFLVNPLIDLFASNINRLKLFYAYVIEHEEINQIIKDKDLKD
jgi:hypothetical protein